MGAATAAAVPSSTTRAGLNPMIFPANSTVMPAAATPVKARCGSPIRLPAAANAASSRTHSVGK